MDRSVRDFRSEIPALCGALGQQQLAYLSGRVAAPSLQWVYSRYRVFRQPDVWFALLDHQAQASVEQKGVAGRSLGFFAQQMERCLAASADEEIATFESGADVDLREEQVPLRRAERELPYVAVRARRSIMERGLGEAFWGRRTLYARRVEAAFRAAERLGEPSYPALLQKVAGEPLADVEQTAKDLLAKTEDAYRDVLSYALKKVEPELRPLPGGSALLHDVSRARVAPQYEGLFRTEDVLRWVTRWLDDWGFSPNSSGRVRFDSENREKPKPAVAVPLRVPEEIWVVLRPARGLGDAVRALHSIGSAFAWSWMPVHWPAEDRWIADQRAVLTVGQLFSGMLRNVPWVERYLGLSRSQARELVRWAAFDSLVELRATCARFLYERALFQHGPETELRDEYQERLRKSLFVDIQSGFFLRDIEPWLATRNRLQGFLSDTAVTHSLREQCNEDFWRNPAARARVSGMVVDPIEYKEKPPLDPIVRRFFDDLS